MVRILFSLSLLIATVADAQFVRVTKEYGCLLTGQPAQALLKRSPLSYRPLSAQQLTGLIRTRTRLIKASRSKRVRQELAREVQILRGLERTCAGAASAVSPVADQPPSAPPPLLTPEPTAIPAPTLVITPEPTVAAPRYQTCIDGLDNDDDGLVDGGDFDCFGPNQSEDAGLLSTMTLDSSGFTVLHPEPDTQVFYVSSDGSDSSNTGRSPASPFKTLRHVHDVTKGRQLGGGRPDWILLRRGDTWTNEMLGDEYGGFTLSGRSPSERLVVGSYGDSALKPTLSSTTGGGIIFTLSPAVRNVALVGIEMRQYDRQWYEGGTALRFLSEMSDVLLEDLRISGFGGAMALQEYVGPIQRVALRRSVIFDQWSNLGHAQGIYTSGVQGLLVEDNVWVRNGWKDGAVVVPLTNASYDPSTRLLTQSGPIWAGPGTTYPTHSVGDTIEIIEGRLATSVINGGPAASTIYEFYGGAELSAVDGFYNNRLVKLVQAGQTQLKRIVRYVGSARKFIVEGGFNEVPNIDDPFEIHAAALAAVEAIVSPNSIRLASGELGDLPLVAVRSGEGFRPTIFNRSMYLSGGSGDTQVIGNIDVLGASGGIQARRGCSDCSRNVLIEAPASISIGHAGNTLGAVSSGVVRQNLILGSRNVNSNHPLGWGITVTGSSRMRSIDGASVRECATYATDVLVHDNLIAHNRSSTGNLRAFVTGPCVVDSQFDSNVVYDWSNTNGAGAAVSPDPLTFGTRAISFTNNDFQQPRGARAIAIDTTPTILAESFLFSGNRLWTGSNPGPVFAFNQALSFAQWVQLSGFGQEQYGEVDYADPGRDVVRYMDHLGIGGGLDNYVNHLLSQSKINWDPRFTANELNNYVRAGFGLRPVGN